LKIILEHTVNHERVRDDTAGECLAATKGIKGKLGPNHIDKGAWVQGTEDACRNAQAALRRLHHNLLPGHVINAQTADTEAEALGTPHLRRVFHWDSRDHCDSHLLERINELHASHIVGTCLRNNVDQSAVVLRLQLHAGHEVQHPQRGCRIYQQQRK